MSFITEWKHRRQAARQAGAARAARRTAWLSSKMANRPIGFYLVVLLIASVVAFICQLGLPTHYLFATYGSFGILRMIVAVICALVIVVDILFLSPELGIHPVVGFILAWVILAFLSGAASGNFFG
jgi:hypothetical protein